MKSIGVFEVKNKLSAVCESVATTSEPVVITRRGEPWVQIQPIPRKGPSVSVWDTVEEGQRKYGPLVDDLELPPRDPEQNRPDPFES